MRVIVIGAGIGGLTLAHGLRAAGLEVEVYERDHDPAATGGYRLHLDARATRILRHRLPEPVAQALLASAPGPQAYTAFSVLDDRLRLLLHAPVEEERRGSLIGRRPLRALLATGLDGTVRWGTPVTAVATSGCGARAHLADGSVAEGDLLVGADGARSLVTTYLTGAPTARPLPYAGVAGRVPLGPATRSLIPDVLRRGPAFAAGPGGAGLFLALQDPASGTAVDPATCTTVPARIEDGYLLWGLTARRSNLPAGAGPLAAARAALGDWSPAVHGLLDATDPASVSAFDLVAADPEADPTPWPSGVATALGDAIHAVPPTGGQGAATAIRDADALVERLAAADRTGTPVPLAVRAYETEVAGYAPAVVRESLQPLRWLRTLGRPGVYPAFRTGLTALRRARRAVSGTDRGRDGTVS